MGRGYQARINRILVMYVKHVTSGRKADYFVYNQEKQDKRAKTQDVPGYDEAKRELLKREEFAAGYELGQTDFRKEAVEKGWVVIPEGE